MNLHEYQAKQQLREHGVPVPEGRAVNDVQAALEAATALEPGPWMVKAQIHAGGRGQAGGVARVERPEALADLARQLLGRRLVTAQTGPEGLPVDTLLIERTTAIAREIYVSFTLDRAQDRVLLIVSGAGGMAIEEVAARTPEAILAERIHLATGLRDFQTRRLSAALGLGRAPAREFSGLLQRLYQAFLASDASLLEINPLILTPTGQWVALDAKLTIDENALYRQPRLAAWRDTSQEDPREAEARALALNYIRLDGTIGCMVNGAGLAMATMDLIQLHGGRPANFLDVGGGATAQRVAAAFKLILSDAQVRAVLVNIFGGIVRCDLIAEGILEAVREVQVAVPVVVRLEGTNAPQGLALLAASGLALTAARGLSEAARQAVELARAGRNAP